MQDMLLTDYFLDQLSKCEGLLAGPLKICQQLLRCGLAEEVIDEVRKDQEKLRKRRAGRRKKTFNRKRKGGPKPMQPEVVMVFCLVRGFYPDIYGERGFAKVLECRSLLEALAVFGLTKMPSRSSVHEQLTCLTEDTLKAFNRMVLLTAKEEQLDDFHELTIDSTAEWTNSAWPVDSDLLVKLSGKLIGCIEKIKSRLTPALQRLLPTARLHHHLKKAGQLNLAINYAKRKKGAESIRKSLYTKLLSRTGKILAYVDVLTGRLDEMDIEEELMSELAEAVDLLDAKHVSTWIRFAPNADVHEHYKPEPVLSVADSTAAFISKGDRETTFGYRPSFGRSRTGFISAFYVEPGNTSDTKAFSHALNDHEQQLGTMPLTTIADDGYTSRENLEFAQNKGVEVVVFGGSKGKRLLGHEVYDSSEHKKLRALRSSVEALISQLKNTRGLKRSSVCGIKRLRQETMVTVIGHNLELLTRLLKRRANDQAMALEKAS